MITVVLWKWGDAYTADHVNRMRAALARHLHLDYRIALITDDTTGVDIHNMDIVSLRHVGGKRHCRRLWIFSDAARILGSTLLQLDLDMVLTGDITPLVESFTPDLNFKIWKCKMSSRYRFGLNPSFMMLRTGVYAPLWDAYVSNPDLRLNHANRDGWPASDQAIISHFFTDIKALTVAVPVCPVWTRDDGILALRDDFMPVFSAPHAYMHEPLPPNCRIVSFHGRFDPSQFTMLDWVREHWLGESAVDIQAYLPKPL